MRLVLTISPPAYFCISAEELPFALRAVELRIAADEAALGIKHFAADNSSAELNLSSPALFHELAFRQPIDYRDELSIFAGRALTTLA